ncbi:WIPF3 protein, partial [Anhinga anhinga]|nr:WIPF3 protein [Anhinga anhinga]
LTEPKGTNRDGVNPAINKGGSQQPLGGLFAGGFPVLRPAGQRDVPAGRPGQLPGARAATPKPSVPPNSSAAKASSNPSHPAEGPRAAVLPEPPSTSRAGASPGRPSLPTPPPPPPASSKPSLTFPPPPPLPPPADRPPKGVSPNTPQPLLPPPQPPLPPPQADKPTKLSFPPSPVFNSALSSADVPPPLPPKSPHLLSQFHKPSSIQSLPLPPTPGLPQPAAGAETRKKRPGRGAGTGAGKLAVPPQPPARSPTTELTSKIGVSAWATAHDPYPPLKNGNMHIIG